MRFTIYGERCSGTNYLEHLMLENFDVKLTWDYGWKHFFGFYNFKKTRDEDNTIFICIVRDPVAWIDSFFKQPHHLPSRMRGKIDAFLSEEVQSFDDNGIEIMGDWSWSDKRLYRNIFELRKNKNKYLLDVLPTLVKNYYFVRYEDILEDYDNILTNISKKFNIPRKNDTFKNIDTYKGLNIHTYIAKPIILNKDIVDRIYKSVDSDQEKRLKYIK